MPETSARMVGENKIIVELGDDCKAGNVSRIELIAGSDGKIDIEEFYTKKKSEPKEQEPKEQEPEEKLPFGRFSKRKK